MAGLLACLLVVGTAQARELKPYAGEPTPPLALVDVHGKAHDLRDYRGMVVLVNFWATWCPPCREEIPSMQRLKAKFAGKPFVILAVDMGESGASVKAFLKEVRLDAVMLLDIDGEALKKWKVFAFPTSFVVDPQGKIRYAVAGATEWDDPETIRRIAELLPAMRR
jgi:thiol-disulfide isomerase/thioredoxin